MFNNFAYLSTSSTPPKNDNEIRVMLSGLLKDYDVKLRPNYLGEPVEVTVDTTLLSISNIDEVNTLELLYKNTHSFHSFHSFHLLLSCSKH